ncbi:DNA processing protein DprA [candidate division SR1 bacterium]|nr:DNA processing protein DprA [candidate division SR1 bacterium]
MTEIGEIIKGSEFFPSSLEICKPEVKKLFYLGNLDLLHKKKLGIVGPRIMSQYADQVLEAFFEQGKNSDLITVSGLARGVDQKCHTLSLKYNIPTIAVLGGGIRRYLKTSDRHLILEIIEKGGLILSEFEADFEPTKWSFPMRNRIIAGLSDSIFLPEAREGSGSLITVDYALNMKKPVFVAPNQLFTPNALGSNQLLSGGKCQLLSNFSQILEIFNMRGVGQFRDKLDEILKSLTDTEKQVFQLVQRYHNQELSTRNIPGDLDFGNIIMCLTMLEMKGIIRQSGPGMYIVS